MRSDLEETRGAGEGGVLGFNDWGLGLIFSGT